MDQLLKKTGGDINEIEKELGIPSGSWNLEVNRANNKVSIIRIDIQSNQIKNLRMPTGNEFGANNLWIPGGITKNGKSEAIIDPINWNDLNGQIKVIVTK